MFNINIFNIYKTVDKIYLHKPILIMNFVCMYTLIVFCSTLFWLMKKERYVAHLNNFTNKWVNFVSSWSYQREGMLTIYPFFDLEV